MNSHRGSVYKLTATTKDWKWLVHQPNGIHVAATLLDGGTASHLREVHGIEASEDAPTNLRTHLEAHQPKEETEAAS